MPDEEHPRTAETYQETCHCEIELVSAVLGQNQTLDHNQFSENPQHLHAERDELREAAAHQELQADEKNDHTAQADRQGLRRVCVVRLPELLHSILNQVNTDQLVHHERSQVHVLQEAQRQKNHESSPVAHADALVNHDAVVVEFGDADVADLAVGGEGRPRDLARRAVAIVVDVVVAAGV